MPTGAAASSGGSSGGCSDLLPSPLVPSAQWQTACLHKRPHVGLCRHQAVSLAQEPPRPLNCPLPACCRRRQVAAAAAVEAPPAQQLDWDQVAAELETKSPLEIMDHVRLPARCLLGPVPGSRKGVV